MYDAIIIATTVIPLTKLSGNCDPTSKLDIQHKKKMTIKVPLCFWNINFVNELWV